MWKVARHIGQLFARSTHGLRHALCRSCLQGRRWAIVSSSAWILQRVAYQHSVLQHSILEAPAALPQTWHRSKVRPHLPSSSGEHHVDLQAVQSGSWYSVHRAAGASSTERRNVIAGDGGTLEISVRTSWIQVIYLLLLGLVDCLVAASPMLISSVALSGASGGGSFVTEVRRSPRQTIHVSAMGERLE